MPHQLGAKISVDAYIYLRVHVFVDAYISVGRWVVEGRWVATLVVHLLATTALWVRIQTSPKNKIWAT
jgi:regulator of protease activity HflC (stomatin/prohibitin superfamily)